MGYSPDKMEEEWQVLKKHLSLVCCAAEDRLPVSPGDIYFLSEGVILKYDGEKICRIIKSQQLIFVPLHPHNKRFRALKDCRLLVLGKSNLYSILEGYPRIVRIYDGLLDLWHAQSQGRVDLLAMTKLQRVEYFKSMHVDLFNYMSRRDIAGYVNVSEEYLRRLF
ncbi:hypothetical protein C4F40_10530 [Sphingobacterium sp. Ka21]|uniref:Crp/Fnr family transcriptional regulator n=2 Tax=Sphingobacterium pedocola TaxID=2082722 RepID=A0ABR9T7U8_9SPHI|nr:hypothetical protein [Sphingobacterium pedocola]